MPSNRNPAVYFDEILKAIEKINSYVAGLSYTTFEELDEKQASVYYRLLVLTESAHRLKSEELALCPGPNWRRLLDLGNVLRHAYDSINPSTIWEILKRDLPPLKLAVEQTLHDHFPEAAG